VPFARFFRLFDERLVNSRTKQTGTLCVPVCTGRSRRPCRAPALNFHQRVLLKYELRSS